jgi:acetolactate synthase-1/2/3 large subunit
MRLTGGQMICESLLREGVEVMFGLPGGAILPLYQTFPEYPQLKHILVRHEQGAGHAADGYARASGKVGVCIATSGPGATNLVTPLATAMMDSVPLVAITGQVPRAAIGRDAFQETDITGVTLPITKHNYLVMHARDLPRVIKEAFYIARTGRPGPVLIDIPRDVQTERDEFEYPEAVKLRSYRPTLEGHTQMIRKAARLIKESRRPLILAGHGVVLSGAFAELQELSEKAQLPVITTLLGISSYRQGHALSLGMPGMHGMAYNNHAIDQADLIIAVGMRFDDRVTGRISTFAPRAKVVHIDIDPAEVGKNVRVEVPIVGDAQRVLRALAREVESATHGEWLKEINRLRQKHPSDQVRETGKLLPQYVIRQLSEATDGDAILVTGVGQHQMWAAQHYTFKQPNSFITSGGLGTMGFEVPAAMGAQIARPDKMVWSIAGDGGFQMTMSELATIVENNVPVKFAIINNGFLGAVRQLQDLFFNKVRVAVKYSGSPDFVKLAEAFGIWAMRVTEKDQVGGAIQKAMAHPGPTLIDFRVEPEENVYPHVPAGESVAEMLEGPPVEASVKKVAATEKMV